jgi:hypothetical protein
MGVIQGPIMKNWEDYIAELYDGSNRPENL